MNKFNVVSVNAGYDVVEFALGVKRKVVDGDVLTDSKGLANWKLGSVVGYALQSGWDPIKSYNDAIANGHETHYAMGMGACISNNSKKGQQRIKVEYGDVIFFHGKYFTIEKANNGNITLVENGEKHHV